MGRRLDDSRITTRLIPIDAIEDHPENYNVHPHSQIVGLAESHSEFGQYRSILVWERPGGKYIRVTGHGFSAGAQQDGATMLRAEVLPEDTPADVVKAIMLADNLHARQAISDDEILARLLQEQEDLGFSLSSLGSDSESLRQLLAELEGEERAPGAGGDDFEPELPEGPTRTHPGEIWQMGEHRLLIGDCVEIDLVEHMMEGERAACTWTDPPYGVSYVGKTKDALTIQNDGPDAIATFLREAFDGLDHFLEEGAALYIAHPAGALSVTFGEIFLEHGWRLHQTLVWVKDSMVLGHSDYHYQHEPILYGYKPGSEGRYGRGNKGWYGDNAQTSVFEIPRPKRSEEHPTMKPVELVMAMLKNSAPRGALIYEPFAGSGSTLIAAHRLAMRCYCVEIDPRYADVVLDRYEAETGNEATLLTQVADFGDT